MRTKPSPTALWTVLATASIGALVLAVYLLRLDSIAGLIIDDAWYVLLAKALAEGAGYRLINSAATEILPLYPPGFPALLSLVFKVAPEFPANIWLLKGVSICAMAGVGVVAYRYFVGYRNVSALVAAGVAVATVLTPAFVLLASSTLMSECVFTLAQLLTVLLIERAARVSDHASGRRRAIFAAIIAAATLLIRTTGVAVSAAAVLYLLRERLWHRALVFVVTVLVCVMPWWVYSRAHAATADERLQHGGHIAIPYTDQFWTRSAGSTTEQNVRLADLPVRIIDNLTNVVSRDVGGILMPVLFRTAGESGLEVVGLGPSSELAISSMGSARGTMLISWALSGLIIAGFIMSWRERVTITELLVPISLAITVLWPFWTFRFILPLTPFLLFYLVAGLRAIASPVGRLSAGGTFDPSAVLRITLLTLVGLNVWDHVRYMLETHQPSVPEAGLNHDANRMQAVLNWISQNLPGDAVIATDNPALVYLHTGRKTLNYNGLEGRDTWKRWKAMGVNYIVCLYPKQMPDPGFYPYRVHFQTELVGLWVIEL